jgi:8-hydroxy-5-deazaflavin:NADPH oxidoreductase
MKIGVLGTGMVGARIATKLIQLGHEVRMGSRTSHNEKAEEWAKKNGPKAGCATFEEAAKFGSLIFLCVRGEAVLEALSLAKPGSFKDKTVIDLTNPLDVSKGMPPTLFICNTGSLGEEVQKALPEANVVKTLNMISNEIMVNPRLVGGEATMFMSGNSQKAKEEVKNLLNEFGWSDIIDLGDITNARGTEMLLPIWLRIWQKLQDGNFAFKIARKI